MRLPRDLSGAELARLFAKYEYRATRQTGSHLRLTSTIKGKEHHITIPKHSPLKIGTLSGILTEVAKYLKKIRKTSSPSSLDNRHRQRKTILQI